MITTNNTSRKREKLLLLSLFGSIIIHTMISEISGTVHNMLPREITLSVSICY